MKLCRHDWFIHRWQRHHSFKHLIIIGNDIPPALSLAVCYGLGVGLLNIFGAPWFASIICGVIVGLVPAFLLAWLFDEGLGWDYDPWKAQDKSCLKCGRIKFDATKSNARYSKRKEARQARQKIRDGKSYKVNIIRNKNAKLAETRYVKMLKLYQNT